MATTDAPSNPDTLTPNATLDALTHGTAIRWWQTTAFCEVAGPDAVKLLDGLCTQAVERIEPGYALPGLFLDGKAKIIAPAIIHRLHHDEPTLLLETLPHLVEPLRTHLSRYRLRAQATIEVVQRATIALVGAATPLDAPPQLAIGGAWSHIEHQAHPTLAWIGETDQGARVISQLTAATSARPAAPSALEAARIEAGTPSLHDLLPGRMPAEVGGMASAVALDAGCYLGQEPVIRLHYRGHANRSLRRLASAGAPDEPTLAPATPEALDLAVVDATEHARAPGRLTTWAQHPDGRTLALAMLRREVECSTTLILTEGSSPHLHALDQPEG